jgi:anti-anti-sigma factor
MEDAGLEASSTTPKQTGGFYVRPDPPCIIRLSGDYDVYTTPELESDLKSSDTVRNVVLDFARVHYIDSTAIAALLRMRTRRRAIGMPAVHFASLSPELRRILTISGLEDAWAWHEDVEHALASFP